MMERQHANLRGNVHGGWIMMLVDQAGGLAAVHHAQCNVVTVAIDQMTFHEPIRVGDFVTLHAALTYVGRTSMEVRVEVIAEDPIVGTRSHTNTAYLVYVALDEEGHPKPIPRLVAETDLEKKRMEEGKNRQKARLERHHLESHEKDP
jgi:acyl-CoA hydrolase